jgi:uncharacterized protein
MNLFTDFDWLQLCSLGMATFILGLTKAGIRGIDMINVTLMALVFGSKLSTGVMLPMLCIGDALAVSYYKQDVKWPTFWRLIGWMLLGILIGVFLGQNLPEAVFKNIFSVIILSSLILLVWMEWRKPTTVTNNPFFGPVLGILVGITTMLGNLAGAFASIYFMANRTPKNELIGTAAVMFMIMNLFKLPFQIFLWKNITWSSIWLNFQLIPILLLGFYLGAKLVGKLKEDSYRKIVIALTFVGALTILLK